MDNKPEKASGVGVLLRVANAAPYGIIAGACGMIVFFSTLGLIVAYAVLSGIEGEMMRTVSFFENWWQVLLFVVDVIAAVAAIASLAMFIVKKVYEGRTESSEEVDSGEKA